MTPTTVGPEDVVQVASAATALSSSACVDIYRANPVLLELREFVVTHVLDAQPATTARALPVVSLRNVVASLLEENRHEEGVRFLAAVGHPALLRDGKVARGLLTIFKPTALVEEDLRRRGAFLLSNQEQQGADYSGVWRVDNERRRRIIQSQQSVLAYLASARTQFLRHWFDDEFGSEGCAFWDYIDELIAQPTPCGDEIGDGLEREMHAHRMSLACLLLEQMCADLAANLCTMDGSIFVKASSEAVRASGRALYPATFMGKLERYFARAAGSPSTREDQRLAALLLDMLAVATSCDALPWTPCAQAVARLLFDQPCGARASAIAKLAGLDMFALEAVDYMLSAWYSVDHEYVGTTRASLAQALSRPPSIEKAALRLRITRPPPKEDSPAGWHCLVRVLAALVQRSMRAFSMRLCRANVHPTSDCAADAACPVTIMVASGTPGAGALWDACQELTRRVASRIPRPDALAAAADVRDDRSDSGDDERALYVELDLLDSFMAQSA